jgi:hypothetical protein
MDTGRIALLIGLAAAVTGWIIACYRDCRRCRGPKERQFIFLSYCGLLALLIGAAVIGVSSLVAIFLFFVLLRWVGRRRLDIRFFEGVNQPPRPSIR